VSGVTNKREGTKNHATKRGWAQITALETEAMSEKEKGRVRGRNR